MISMPHFGLIREGISKDEEALLRARLHIRGGDRRLEEGQFADAVASYYDAMSAGMKRFFLSESLRDCYVLPDVSNLEDDGFLFIELKGAGVLDDSINMEEFDFLKMVLEKAFENEVTDEILTRFRSIVQKIGVQLHIIPFVPGELPEVDSLTL